MNPVILVRWYYLDWYSGWPAPGLVQHHQQSAQNCKYPAMTSTPHLIDHWFWLPRNMSWQGFHLRELQKKLSLAHRPRSGKTNLTLCQDL